MGAYAVIMAGGSGTRFWPLSRRSLPKHLLPLSDPHKSMLLCTAERASRLTGIEGVWVVTNAEQSENVKEHVPYAKVLDEPIGRNTAATIGLAALHIRRLSPDAVMIVLPADHAISDETGLLKVLEYACEIADKKSSLVTIGIRPTHPHTGYGYINRGHSVAGNCYRVVRFAEKPDLPSAQRFCNSGDYFWNSGMFVWRVEAILAAIEEYLPELHKGLCEIDSSIGTESEKEVLTAVFPALPSVSIDYGVMEKSDNCMVVCGDDFGWNDVGSWDQWALQYPGDQNGNVCKGDVVVVDSKGCVLVSDSGLTAVVGLEDVIVVRTKDAVLVCRSDQAQKVKEVVAQLDKTGRDEIL